MTELYGNLAWTLMRILSLIRKLNALNRGGEDGFWMKIIFFLMPKYFLGIHLFMKKIVNS